jgi:hypothetical protein
MGIHTGKLVSAPVPVSWATLRGPALPCFEPRRGANQNITEDDHGGPGTDQLGGPLAVNATLTLFYAGLVRRAKPQAEVRAGSCQKVSR